MKQAEGNRAAKLFVQIGLLFACVFLITFLPDTAKPAATRPICGGQTSWQGSRVGWGAATPSVEKVGIASQDREFEPDEYTVALYHFNEGTGKSITDTSGNGNQGTAYGNISWTSGRFGYALSFDGNEGYVRIPDSPSFDRIVSRKALTIEFWIYLRSYPSYPADHLVTKWSGTGHNRESEFYLDVRYDGKISFFLNSGPPDVSRVSNVLSQVPIPLRSWQLVSCIWDGVSHTAAIYLNGREVGRIDAAVSSVPNSTTPVIVSGSAPYTLDAVIDELRISDVARYPIGSSFAVNLGSLSPGLDDFSTDDPQIFEVWVNIENHEGRTLSRVVPECSIDGNSVPIEIQPPSRDWDQDAIIDSIPPGNTTVRIAKVLLPNRIWENKEISVRLAEIEGVSVQIAKTYRVSTCYVTDDFGRTFEPTTDAYNFQNRAATFKDLFRAVQELRPTLASYWLVGQFLGMWSGLCLGMASTVQIYFEYPSVKPISPNTATASLKWDDWPVRRNIIFYHFWGNLQTGFSDIPVTLDFANTVKKKLLNNHPCVVILGAEDDANRHACTVVKTTEDLTDRVLFLYLYDPNYPGEIRTAMVDERAGSFKYSYRDRAMVWDPHGALKVQTLGDSLSQRVASLVHSLSRAGQMVVGQASPVRLLIVDQYGRRVGYVRGGAEVHEVPGASVRKYASGEVDSAIFYILPRDLSYTITIYAIGEGTANLEVVVPSTEQSALRSGYYGVLVKQGSVGTLYYSSGTVGDLNMDSDGDGRTDFTIRPQHMLITSVQTREQRSSMPSDHVLISNYPNPFNSQTRIVYSLPTRVNVKIEVLDVAGRHITTLQPSMDRGPGCYSVVWDGQDESGHSVVSGVYMCRMIAGDRKHIVKMLLLR